jgi:hypothetical protein
MCDIRVILTYFDNISHTEFYLMRINMIRMKCRSNLYTDQIRRSYFINFNIILILNDLNEQTYFEKLRK